MSLPEDDAASQVQLALVVIIMTLALVGSPSATAASTKCSLLLRNSSEVAEEATSLPALCCNACPAKSACTAEDTCTCEHGYAARTRKASLSCLPVCSPACGRNEQCTVPGRCECKDGYTRGGEKDACSPVCAGGCGVGMFCFRPEVCVCKRGYTSVEGECVPQCKSCINGHCVEPDRCECLPGFVQTSPGGACVPACGGGTCSGHGRCDVVRDACVCDEGYAYAGGAPPHECEPYCAGGCGGGRCEAPDTCVCSEGYATARPGAGPALGPCVPLCPGGCPNGHCAAPNRCECNPGFERSDDNAGTCRPLCSPPCVNATCTGPNECRCWPAHRPHPHDAFVCEPQSPTTPPPTLLPPSLPTTIVPNSTAVLFHSTSPSELTTNSPLTTGKIAYPPTSQTPPSSAVLSTSSSLFASDWISSDESGNGVSSAQSGLPAWLRLENCGSNCAIGASVTALVAAMIVAPLATKLACALRNRRRLSLRAQEESPLWL